jgi:hypothetical protein
MLLKAGSMRYCTVSCTHIMSMRYCTVSCTHIMSMRYCTVSCTCIMSMRYCTVSCTSIMSMRYCTVSCTCIMSMRYCLSHVHVSYNLFILHDTLCLWYLKRRMRREKRKRRQLHKLQGQKTVLVTVLCCDNMAPEQLQAPPTVVTAQ